MTETIISEVSFFNSIDSLPADPKRHKLFEFARSAIVDFDKIVYAELHAAPRSARKGHPVMTLDAAAVASGKSAGAPATCQIVIYYRDSRGRTVQYACSRFDVARRDEIEAHLAARATSERTALMHYAPNAETDAGAEISNTTHHAYFFDLAHILGFYPSQQRRDRIDVMLSKKTGFNVFFPTDPLFIARAGEILRTELKGRFIQAPEPTRMAFRTDLVHRIELPGTVHVSGPLNNAVIHLSKQQIRSELQALLSDMVEVLPGDYLRPHSVKHAFIREVKAGVFNLCVMSDAASISRTKLSRREAQSLLTHVEKSACLTRIVDGPHAISVSNDPAVKVHVAVNYSFQSDDRGPVWRLDFGFNQFRLTPDEAKKLPRNLAKAGHLVLKAQNAFLSVSCASISKLNLFQVAKNRFSFPDYFPTDYRHAKKAVAFAYSIGRISEMANSTLRRAKGRAKAQDLTHLTFGRYTTFFDASSYLGIEFAQSEANLDGSLRIHTVDEVVLFSVPPKQASRALAFIARVARSANLSLIDDRTLADYNSYNNIQVHQSGLVALTDDAIEGRTAPNLWRLDQAEALDILSRRVGGLPTVAAKLAA